MLKNYINATSIKVGLLVLIIFNVLAYYFIKESISIIDALEHAENQKVISSLHQKSTFYTIFSAIIITIDIAFFLLFTLSFT